MKDLREKNANKTKPFINMVGLISNNRKISWWFIIKIIFFLLIILIIFKPGYVSYFISNWLNEFSNNWNF